MGRKRTPGLIDRKGVWHIDKQVRGSRICESTGTGNLAEAEAYLARRIEEIRQAKIYGVRPKRSFRQAATKYLNEATKATIDDDAMHLRQLNPFIGDLSLDSVHMGTLQQFIDARKAAGVKSRTINMALGVVRHVLKLAATEWLDENNVTWLQTPAKIRMLPETDQRKPYPLSLDEQTKLFRELPPDLHRMALFAVNTGCREHEVCGLRWQWEVEVPELETSVFIIPGVNVKNGADKLVVLNRIALSVVDDRRGVHPEYVFTYRGKPLARMNNSGWRAARLRAGLPHVRVHDLRHTMGRRLRAAGVSLEDREDLLGHKSVRITTHYSQAELHNLIKAANAVCDLKSRKSPALVVLKSGIVSG